MTFEISNEAKFVMTSSGNPPETADSARRFFPVSPEACPANDDRSAAIHWAQSKMASRGSLFFVFKDSVRIAECWNTATADLLVTALRQLSDCQRPEGD